MSSTSSSTEPPKPDVHYLCQIGDSDSLKQLIESLEDPIQRAGLVSRVINASLLPLHVALLHAHPECVELLMRAEADPTLHYEGSMPVHLSLALSGFAAYRPACTASLETLLSYDSVNINSRDRLGRTPLHLAVMNGATDSVALLLQREADAGIKDFSGRQAVDWAIECDQVDSLRLILQELGSELILKASLAHLAVRHAAWKCFAEILSLGSEAVLQLVNASGQTPAYIAESCKLSDEFESVKAGTLPFNSRQTLLLTHEVCFEHAALPEEVRSDPNHVHAQQRIQPEVPQRLEVLVGKFGSLSTDYFAQRLTLVTDFQAAPIVDVLRVHDFNYIRRLQKLSRRVQGLEHLDRDTIINDKSLSAALMAAGSVIHAVDQVLSGLFTNAFCAVRPPGHHAGPFGEVSSDEPSVSSSGFCLLNNIAIGAAYAMCVYRDQVKKVAIIDFDVHHGNGTQAILDNLKPSHISNKVQLDFATAEIKTHTFKPWLGDEDYENIRFFSSHAYGRDETSVFYPASGTEEENHECVHNLPLSYGTQSDEFRQTYREKVFPKIIEFKPDLVFVSAGFDAHSLDEINQGFIALDEDDYEWLTGELVKVANSCCKGRIISVLEGGYRTRGGTVSALAQSVAAHVRKLSSRSYEEYSESFDPEAEINRQELKRQHDEASSRMNLRKRRPPSPERLADIMKEFDEDITSEEDSLT